MVKMHGFRQYHFLQILRAFDLTRGPLDLFLHLYFKNNHQLGSKDRVFIVDRIYAYFRWKNRIDQQIAKLPVERQDDGLLELVETLTFAEDVSIPEWVRSGFPEELFKAFHRSWGEKASELCRLSNEVAPIYIRVNTAKIQPEELLMRLQSQGVLVEKTCFHGALHVLKRVSLSQLPEFREGLFEMQDIGSQMVAECVAANAGDLVLDFCAGAGGKSLAIARHMAGKGQLFLHDIRQEALAQAKVRCKRAGVQNIQIIHSEEQARLNRLRGKMNWVLVDAPCSGTGTLRRNPDMKWKFSSALLARLVAEQRSIVEAASSFLAPQGRLVYATCSVLKEENQEQVSYFLEQFPWQLVNEPLCVTPFSGSDGFFAATFEKKGNVAF